MITSLTEVIMSEKEIKLNSEEYRAFLKVQELEHQKLLERENEEAVRLGKINIKPSTYTTERANELCMAVATTPRPVKEICAENPNLPSIKTIAAWRVHHKEFRDQYYDAKRHQAELLVDEIIQICDDPANCEPEILNYSKLKIQTRQWLAQKLLYKIYGVQKDPDEDKSTIGETLSKIQSMVNEFNKTNESDI